jgi:hypothetical protein
MTRACRSTYILDLLIATLSRPQITRQRSPEQLQQHLKANARDRRIIPSLTQLVSNEGVLRPGHFVETESRSGVVQRLADKVTPFRWNMVVALSEDLVVNEVRTCER